MAGAAARSRYALAERLRARQGEIEQATLARVSAISQLPDKVEHEYLDRLRETVSVGIDFAISAIERKENHYSPIPTVLRAQARLAARSDVALETVLRRYFAGFVLLGDFLIEEAERGGLDGPQLKDVLRAQAAVFERTIAAVSEEYGRELALAGSAADRKLVQVKRLLAAELVETSEIPYEFAAWHVGAVALGTGAEEAVRDLAARLDARLLRVSVGDGSIWAWFGRRRQIDPSELARFSCQPGWAGSLAVGEPAEGLMGWRLTHAQARAALPIAVRNEASLVRYADVSLLAAALRDDVLAKTLRGLYLVPLQRDRDGGVAALQTLRAYLGAERNVTSAAAALGVARRTVTNRLRAIEEKLDLNLAESAAQIEIALQLDEHERNVNSPSSMGSRGSHIGTSRGTHRGEHLRTETQFQSSKEGYACSRSD